MPGGGEPSRAARRVLRSASGKAATSSAVELEEIEEVIDEAGAALVGGLLHEADVGNAVWTHGAEFTVEIGRLD